MRARALTLSLFVASICPATPMKPGPSLQIGTLQIHSPYGIAMIVDNDTGFLVNPEFDERPAGLKSPYGPSDIALVPPPVAAPDSSIVKATIPMKGARITWTWGRIGRDAVVATLASDKTARITLRLTSGWPRFHGSFNAVSGGIDGFGIHSDGRYQPFRMRCAPAPAVCEANMSGEGRLVFNLEPNMPVSLALGLGELPALKAVPSLLALADATFQAKRPRAAGSWGDFLAPITENLTYGRVYASDNKRVAHGIGRGWWIARKDPDRFPYFEWDSFFQGFMASLDDPEAGKQTFRTVLSYQTPDGFVPSYSHWDVGSDAVSFDRSMPPVGAMCIWKFHERRPDKALLAEAYPKLTRWHAWWPKARDANHNGLLEWGSDRGIAQAAWWETGWDDTVHYEGAEMVGRSMNVDAVDLSALWAMDAEYLARIAEALGKRGEAAAYRSEQALTNQRINQRLWNESLGLYCSRAWEVPQQAGESLSGPELFPGGLEGTYFKDRDLQDKVVQRQEPSPDFGSGKAPSFEGLPKEDWSARWEGKLGVPRSGRYRLSLGVEGGARMWINEKLVVDRWNSFPEPRNADLDLQGGQTVSVRIEAFFQKGPASLSLTARPLSPGKPGSDWYTRITPMNFYPLISGAANPERARRTLDYMGRKDTFWGDWIVPTVAYTDPVWPDQGYWRGNVWPSSNYLVWQGLKRYATPEMQMEFAAKSVALFMRNWNTEARICGENYKSTDGSAGGHPHYTWGALLCQIGLEALAEPGSDFKPVARPFLLQTPIVLEHVPFGGRLYRLEAQDGQVRAIPEPRSPLSPNPLSSHGARHAPALPRP